MAQNQVDLMLFFHSETENVYQMVKSGELFEDLDERKVDNIATRQIVVRTIQKDLAFHINITMQMTVNDGVDAILLKERRHWRRGKGQIKRREMCHADDLVPRSPHFRHSGEREIQTNQFAIKDLLVFLRLAVHCPPARTAEKIIADTYDIILQCIYSLE